MLRHETEGERSSWLIVWPTVDLADMPVRELVKRADEKPFKLRDLRACRLDALQCLIHSPLALVQGFPYWDEAVHSILHSSFTELVSVFYHYCKQGGIDETGSGWSSMDAEEWISMCVLLPTYSKRL